MDILENFVDQTALTIENVKVLVDDYSLISYYVGEELDLRTKYSSPLREGDEDPSFSMFYGYGDSDETKLYFKDHSSIGSGDVFDFIGLKLGTTNLRDILKQINCDFGLGLGGDEEVSMRPTVIKKIPIIKESPDMAFVLQSPTKEYMSYWWDKYEITKKYTEIYHTTCVRDIHYIYSDKVTIITPKDLCIGYYIGKYVKSYQPFADKNKKFRNNFPSNYVEGHLQLDWSRNDLLVITKATKECILFRKHWNIQAVAGKSESIFIPDFIMQIYLSHFKRVVLWLDPDSAGIQFTGKYMQKYPKLIQAIVPPGLEKDPTDIFEARRKKITTDIVKSVLRI